MSLEQRHERLKQRLDEYAPFNQIPFVLDDTPDHVETPQRASTETETAMIYHPRPQNAQREALVDFIIGLLMTSLFLAVMLLILSWMYEQPAFRPFLDSLNHCKDQPPGCL